MAETEEKRLMMRTFFELPATRRLPRVAIFLSGSGSNAEVLLKRFAASENPDYEIVVIVTDNPESSRAGELAEMFGLPLVSLSIRAFYRERGESRVSLATARGCEIREEWTGELLKRLEDYQIDFGIFAGFVPLCNVPEAFPCLNVHPGDLTVTDADGNRTLVGLHTLPVERAILSGFDYMRSSVLVVQKLENGGGNMDAGPLLGVSGKVAIDFCGHTLEELKHCAEQRPDKRPVGGYKDVLEEVAAHNQDRLKYAGDHVVLPRAADFFARRYYRTDESGEALYFSAHGEDFSPVVSIEFLASGEYRVIK